MEPKASTLANGLHVLSIFVPGAETITVEVGVKAGTRFETKEQHGMAHFLEHLFFKGGRKYKNAREVSEVVDLVGGNFNAYTSMEYVGYYVKTAKEDRQVAFDVLSDMLCFPLIPEEEIEKERGVIYEEMNMYEDDPSSKVSQIFDSMFYGDHPLGWDTLGTKESLAKMKREDFMKFLATWYVPDNMLVTVVGNIHHDQVVKEVESFFHFPTEKVSHVCEPFLSFPEERVIRCVKPIEQVQIILGVPGFSARDERRYAAKILSIILGGNMSSRLFLKIREEMSLCYSIQTSRDAFLDTGSFCCMAGVDVKRSQQAIDAILAEFELIRTEGITEEELKKAQSFINGKISINLEDTSSIADFFAHDHLLYQDLMTPSDLKACFHKVTVDEVNAVAKELFDPKAFRLALVGPKGILKSEIRGQK